MALIEAPLILACDLPKWLPAFVDILEMLARNKPTWPLALMQALWTLALC